MKKIIILLLSVGMLVGCNTAIDKLIDETKTKVTKELKNVEDIGKDKVKKSIKYIMNNYTKKIDQDFIYNTLVLKTVTANNSLKGNIVKELADTAYEYMMKQSSDNKEKLEKVINNIDDDLDAVVDEFYDIYKNSVVVNTYFAKAKTQIVRMRNTNNFINKDSIKREISIIISNYKNYYRDDEVIEKISYSVMYLDDIGTRYGVDNNIIKLARYTKKYMQENDSKYLEEINKILKDTKNNMDQYIEEIINAINK